MATNQKPISRSITDSDKLLKIPAEAKCFYIFQKLHADNLATIKANPYFLKGELYPKDDSVTPDTIKKMIKQCVEVGLLIHYSVNGIDYLHDPQAGKHEKMVGNMSRHGEYPLPPAVEIEKWEKAFNSVYTSIGNVYTPLKSVNTPYIHNLTPLESVNTPSKSVLPEDTDKDKDKDIDKNKEANTAKDKEKIEKEKKEKPLKLKFVDFVFLSEEQYQKLIERFGKDNTQKWIEKLNNYIGAKGDKYKSHYHTILNWVDREKEDEKSTNKEVKDADYYERGFDGGN